VEKDENILEISTDKVDSEIPAPSGGRLAKVLIPEGETVEVGTVVAEIETDPAAPIDDEARPAQGRAGGETPAGVSAGPSPSSEEQEEDRAGEPAPPAAEPAGGSQGSEGIPRRDGGRFYSPLVRSLAKEHGMSFEDLEAISGSGRGGRVTKRDLQSYIEERSAAPVRHATSAKASGAFAPAPPFPGMAAPAASPGGPPMPVNPPLRASGTRRTPYGRVDVVEMNNMRRKIADHMVKSKATSAHVYSVIEADVTRVVAHREGTKALFQSHEGFKLTYTPYFVEASVRALRDFPFINASIEGDLVLLKRFINIGVAVALEEGLIVPVVQRADSFNFVGLARAVDDLAERARTKKLTPDEVQGGTFTITNMGGFGTLFGIPVINQPQVAILGVGAIEKRPVVVGDNAIGIRDRVYLSLSFDHRLVDGAMAGQFLARVKWEVETMDLPRVGG